MWWVIVSCLAGPFVCGIGPRDKAIEGPFATQAKCEIEVVEVYRKFKPGGGAYAFNCRRIISGRR